MYEIALKKTTQNTYRICLTSSINGKLILQGESINNRKDAFKTMSGIAEGYGAKGKLKIGEDLKPHHKFPANAGPKKKKAVKKAAPAKKPAVKKASK